MEWVVCFFIVECGVVVVATTTGTEIIFIALLLIIVTLEEKYLSGLKNISLISLQVERVAVP